MKLSRNWLWNMLTPFCVTQTSVNVYENASLMKTLVSMKHYQIVNNHANLPSRTLLRVFNINKYV